MKMLLLNGQPCPELESIAIRIKFVNFRTYQVIREQDFNIPGSEMPISGTKIDEGVVVQSPFYYKDFMAITPLAVCISAKSTHSIQNKIWNMPAIDDSTRISVPVCPYNVFEGAFNMTVDKGRNQIPMARYRCYAYKF